MLSVRPAIIDLSRSRTRSCPLKASSSKSNLKEKKKDEKGKRLPRRSQRAASAHGSKDHMIVAVNVEVVECSPSMSLRPAKSLVIDRDWLLKEVNDAGKGGLISRNTESTITTFSELIPSSCKMLKFVDPTTFASLEELLERIKHEEERIEVRMKGVKQLDEKRKAISRLGENQIPKIISSRTPSVQEVWRNTDRSKLVDLELQTVPAAEQANLKNCIFLLHNSRLSKGFFCDSDITFRSSEEDITSSSLTASTESFGNTSIEDPDDDPLERVSTKPEPKAGTDAITVKVDGRNQSYCKHTIRSVVNAFRILDAPIRFAGRYCAGAVFLACLLPRTMEANYEEIMESFYLHIVKQIQGIDKVDFVFIYVNSGMGKSQTPDVQWVKRVFTSLDSRFLQKILLVSPTFFTKTCLFILSTILSRSFVNKVQSVESVYELLEIIPDLRHFQFPSSCFSKSTETFRWLRLNLSNL